jgi:hypothetical protein
MACGIRPCIERAAEAEALRRYRDDRGPMVGGDLRRPVARSAVDEGHLQLSHPPLGGEDVQAAGEVRGLVARTNDDADVVNGYRALRLMCCRDARAVR